VPPPHWGRFSERWSSARVFDIEGLDAETKTARGSD
jgi:hypothetical protein